MLVTSTVVFAFEYVLRLVVVVAAYLGCVWKAILWVHYSMVKLITRVNRWRQIIVLSGMTLSLGTHTTKRCHIARMEHFSGTFFLFSEPNFLPNFMVTSTCQKVIRILWMQRRKLAVWLRIIKCWFYYLYFRFIQVMTSSLPQKFNEKEL